MSRRNSPNKNQDDEINDDVKNVSALPGSLGSDSDADEVPRKKKHKSSTSGEEGRRRAKPRKPKKNEVPFPEEAPQEFLNREIEWLEFNARVLHEAVDTRTPLLERVRFLGIFTSNLDEFIMKRVGGLRRQVEAGVQRQSGGLLPLQQLAEIGTRVRSMLAIQADCFKMMVEKDLRENGICLLRWKDLNDKERDVITQYFRLSVFPILTPLAVDPGLPFPFLSNLSTSLGVTLRHPEREEKLFARIKVPKILPQWIQVRAETPVEGEFRFLSLMEVIAHNMNLLFPDMEVLDIMAFRITRNAEVERDEDDIDDLLETIAEELKQRRFAEVVRLEHGPDPDPWMLRFLMDELELTEAGVFEVPSIMDYTELKPIADLDLPKLKFSPWTPLVSHALQEAGDDIFSVIRAGDLMVHHPYESFTASVERFIRQAVDDPKVLAIKMTLYRTGDDSPFVPLLIHAAERGKQVVVLIELKARFDEERNIHWAHQLESAGVHVVYGVMGLKTHTKVALVIRQEGEALNSYVHLATGNYHKQTAKLYTDIGYFTCTLHQPSITEDAVELFHFLTGRSLKRSYRKLLVAPINLKDAILAMIKREMENAKAGKPAYIIIKCNSFEEVTIGRALYEASQAGVEIDLIVRGFCCLRPRVVGLSDRIRVISIVGRFLEHSRVFYFRNAATTALEGEFYIGSADMMHRNLLARIEAVTPIAPMAMRERLWEILQIMLADQRSAWDMQPDGSYIQRMPVAIEAAPSVSATSVIGENGELNSSPITATSVASAITTTGGTGMSIPMIDAYTHSSDALNAMGTHIRLMELAKARMGNWATDGRVDLRSESRTDHGQKESGN